MNDGVRFETQLPRTDGCGVVVLQMISGRSYDAIADIIGFSETVHRSTWTEITRVLDKLQRPYGPVTTVSSWSEVEGLAIVHVKPDHFMLYDAQASLYYDPGFPTGPQRESALTPMAYMTVDRTSD